MANFCGGKNVDDEKVRYYFDKIADEFDSIYEYKGSLLSRIIHKLFRKSMFERIPISVQESRPLQGKSVLDVGCGSGRLSFLLGKEGAKVTGIDYARSMIDLAKKYQQKLKAMENIEFICCDFVSAFPEDKKYDVSIALGVFDYIEDPMPLLIKMKNMSTTKMIASYPAKFTFQSPLRKVWLARRNCPVFFYTKGQLKQIYSNLGFEDIKIISLPLGAMLADVFLVISALN